MTHAKNMNSVSEEKIVLVTHTSNGDGMSVAAKSAFSMSEPPCGFSIRSQRSTKRLKNTNASETRPIARHAAPAS
jgi:hypothetical protein